MTREELTKRAEALVRKQWTDYNDDPCPDIRPETLFADHLRFDSLDHVELVLEFEDEFDIEVSDEDAEGLKTFSQAVAYLAQRLQVAA